jgi:hypothetical protein
MSGRLRALTAATDRQPGAGLLTTAAYLMVATGVCLFIVKVIGVLSHL